MAQQKMHCALQRTSRNTPKIADGGNSSLWKKSLEQNNFIPSSRDCEVSSFVWRNSDHRCAIFFALEHDGRWRIVALPMHCPDPSIHFGSGAQVKMDGLHLISPSPVSSVKVDRQKAHGGNTSDRSCSVKSFTARNFSGSNFERQSRNKGLANKVRWNQFRGNSSCQNSLRGGDSSVMIPSGSDVTNSPDIHVDVSEVDKAVKRNSRKKARKKGKRNKKLSCDASSTELECARGSSIAETGLNKNMDHGVGSLPYATTLAVPLPELSCNGNDIEGNNNGTIDCFELPKTCTSFIDEVDVSEALSPSVVQNFGGEQSSSNSENGTQTDFPEVFIYNGGIQDIHSKSIGFFKDAYSSVLSEPQDSFVFDSVSVGSNSDKSIYCSCDVKISNGESSGINPSESPGSTAKKGCFPRGNMLNGLVGSYYHAAGTNKGANSDMHSVVPAKRSKQIKRVPQSSSVHRVSSVETFRGRSGKENYHSVWQKVQRNDAGECNYELNKVNSVCSLPDIELKEAPLLKKNCNVVESNKLLNREDKSQSKLKVSRKLKRKTSPGSKQEYNGYSSKGSHATKANSNVSTKINLQQNELLDVPARVSGKKGLASVSRSHSKISCTKIGFQINGVESISSDPVQSLQVSPNQLELREYVHNDVCSSNNKPAQNENSLLSKSCDYLDQSELLEGQSAVYLRPLGGDEATKIEKDVSTAEHSKQDHSTGSILQKWIPVGMKDSLLMSSCLSNDNLAQSAAGTWTSKDVAEEELASDHQTLPSLMVGTEICTVQDSGESNGLPSENGDTQKLRNHSVCIPKPCCTDHANGNCLVHEPKGQNNFAFENDSNKMAQAVNDAYNARLASEALQMATGCPIAEFERLLHSASPVICLQHNTISCQTCSNDGAFREYLCRHEKPRIPLGCLWQWYEKHGSYGLEVRAEDYEQSKRLGIDRFTFRAYFVPFLSAVQLFRNRKSRPLDNKKGTPGTETMGACEMDEITENPTNIGHLPIFSVLVPQPRTEETSFLPQRLCCVEPSSACIKDDASIQSVDSAWSVDEELLFEYFEVEQPHQRRPLFEMIKELVRGDGPSQCRAYGDPTTLDSVNLLDLHPKSWYSVAWYPIYRIPDGNFRAAFLTYHSLGHLVHRSATSKSLSENACIVSPVVGLQSYNAQGECWFQPRNSAPSQTAENAKSNPSGILKERLRTLEHTASLMARDVVTKGSLKSVNRQPDYEFFLSRRC